MEPSLLIRARNASCPPRLTAWYGVPYNNKFDDPVSPTAQAEPSAFSAMPFNVSAPLPPTRVANCKAPDVPRLATKPSVDPPLKLFCAGKLADAVKPAT